MGSDTSYSRYVSPVGPWLLLSDGDALTGVFPETHHTVPLVSDGWKRDDALFTGVRDQLDAYFAGRLTNFTVRLGARGTAFQHKVWAALREIPVGTTTTYGALAAQLGSPTAARAVGAANGKNPLSLIVPCHRVIGCGGSLTGYAGGVKLKQWLLEHEATMVRPRKNIDAVIIQRLSAARPTASAAP